METFENARQELKNEPKQAVLADIELPSITAHFDGGGACLFQNVFLRNCGMKLGGGLAQSGARSSRHTVPAGGAAGAFVTASHAGGRE